MSDLTREMTLHLDVERHQQAISDGFAKLRSKLQPIEPERTFAQQITFSQMQAMGQIPDRMRQIEMAYSPGNVMNMARADAYGFSWLLGF